MLTLVPGRAAAAAPRVLVSVKPLHSLVAGVMDGVGVPDLLVRGAASPHGFSLKPSDARLIEGAGVIFWVGEPLEGFLAKPLAALGRGATVVAASRMAGVALLPVREGGPWEEHHAHRGAGDEHEDDGEHGGAGWDAHLWLDPVNARAIARAAAETLGRVDPPNRERYAANAASLAGRIDALAAHLASRLAPVRDVPFVVFHDGYQYFEKAYGLRAVGSVVVSPERAPGARRVSEMRAKIRGLGARCVFSEPQFPSALVGTLIEGSTARAGALDPLGADQPAGPEAWFGTMRALADAFVSCLR